MPHRLCTTWQGPFPTLGQSEDKAMGKVGLDLLSSQRLSWLGCWERDQRKDF